MPKTKSQKQEEVKKLKQSFASAKSAVFTSYDGLTVAQSQELRNNLRNEKVKYLACKKTLFKRALEGSKLDFNPDEFSGSLAVAFGKEDEVAPAKILADFAKDKEALKIQGGILEGKFINASKVLELAKLPSRLELIAKTVATINAPISGFVNVLAGNIRGLVNVLNGIKKSKS